MTCSIEGLEASASCAQRHCHISASPHQWPTQEPRHVNHKLTDPRCRPKGTRQPFSAPGHMQITGFVSLNKSRRTNCICETVKQEEAWQETHLFPRICNVQEIRNERFWTHIKPINCSNKDIPSSPSKMWVMQTFAPVYGMIIIYAISQAAHARLCLFCVAQALQPWNLRGRKEPVSCGQKAF